MYKVTLTKEDLEVLSKPVVGQGGFEDLLRKLQSSIRDGVLVVDKEIAERIIRYVDEYGCGGWQDRLQRIAEELKGQTDSGK